MIFPAVFLGLVAASLGQDFIFADSQAEVREEEREEVREEVRECLTVSGEPCQFPFIFRGLERTGCITESDPAGLLWCSTLLDSEGRHVAGGGHWDHCQPGCPQHSARNETSAELTVENSGLCFTRAGEEGKCRLGGGCIGATIRDLETNSCELSDGSPGTCCVPVTIDNIINIIDSPRQTISLPGSVDPGQANDILRSNFGQVEAGDRVRFASEEPAEDVEVDTNFVDDPTPTNLHLR